MDLARPKILIVDDSEADRLLAESYLMDVDADLISVGSGEEAIELADDPTLALILLDTRMPGMDGFETATRIRAKNSCGAVPIVFLTGVSVPDLAEFGGYSAGAIDVIAKSAAPDILDHKVRSFLELFRSRRLLVEKVASVEALNQKLQEVSNQKNWVLGMVAHDLRNPLTSALGQAELLGEQVLGPLRPSQQKAAAAIRRGLASMQHLIDDLLDHAAIEAGELRLDRSATDIAGLVRSSIDDTIDTATQSDVQIRSEVSEGLPEVLIDPRRITQVLCNLLGNAIRFSPAGAEIIVSVQSEANTLILGVADQGPGIARSEHDALFRPFSKTENSAPGPQKNMGLGLAIVQRIVEAHGGEIWLESELGRGTTFRVALPVAYRHKKAA